MTGTAAHVTYLATSCHFSCEAIEQIPVKRLALELAGDSERILICNAIVTFANRLYAVAVRSLCVMAARECPSLLSHLAAVHSAHLTGDGQTGGNANGAGAIRHDVAWRDFLRLVA